MDLRVLEDNLVIFLHKSDFIEEWDVLRVDGVSGFEVMIEGLAWSESIFFLDILGLELDILMGFLGVFFDIGVIEGGEGPETFMVDSDVSRGGLRGACIIEVLALVGYGLVVIYFVVDFDVVVLGIFLDDIEKLLFHMDSYFEDGFNKDITKKIFRMIDIGI